MQIGQNGDWIYAARITGPTHNYLALRLIAGEAGETSEPLIEALPDEGKARVRSEDVKGQVSETITWWNEECPTKVRLVGIRYVPSDTPSDRVYGSLAHTILKHFLRESVDTDNDDSRA